MIIYSNNYYMLNREILIGQTQIPRNLLKFLCMYIALFSVISLLNHNSYLLELSILLKKMIKYCFFNSY